MEKRGKEKELNSGKFDKICYVRVDREKCNAGGEKVKRHRFWKLIGRTKDGRPIYKNLDTGEIAKEIDYAYLVELKEEELKEAEIHK